MKISLRKYQQFMLGAVGLVMSASSLAAADSVYRYGKIYTMDPNKPTAQAIAIENGTITYVGSNAGVRKHIGRNTNVVNLYASDMIFPGLHDVHQHPLEAGSDRIFCSLNKDQSVQQWLSKISNCAGQNKPWILGHGSLLTKILDDGRSPKQMLDNISTSKPIVIMDMTSHSAWVNSKALNMIGINQNTANPPGGHIGKDSNGNLNGILLDTAGDMAFHAALNNPTNSEKSQDYQGLLWSLKQLAKNGITSVADARVYWKRDYLDAWYKAKNQNKLTVRATLGLWIYPEDSDDFAQIDTLVELYDDSNPMLRVTEVKAYADGLVDNTTAAMKEDYLKEIGVGIDSNNGLNYLEQSRLALYVRELERENFNVHIHAIGDRGVHEALNAIESAANANQNRNIDPRHRLTHLEYVDPVDLPRLKALNVVADMQVSGPWTLPGQSNPVAVELLGQHRHEREIPLREVYDADATLTISSDWDVASLSPFVGMKHALSRGDKSLPNLHAALEAYTINAAWALNQDDIVGSIKVGKKADLTIVDRDIFKTSIANLDKTKVVMTVVNGKIVHEL